MSIIIAKKILNNLLICLCLSAPTIVIAGEACHWKCNPGRRCGDLDQTTKICHPIPRFGDRQQLYKEAEKIGFVGQPVLKAFDKLSDYGCHEGYRTTAYWACSRPMQVTPCGTQIQTIILDMVPSEGEVEPQYVGTQFAMKVGSFRTLLTTNCVEEVDYLNLSLKKDGEKENSAMNDGERFYRKTLVETLQSRIRKEGIAVTEKIEELGARFINGELTTEQFVVEGLKLYLPKAPRR